MRFHVPGLPHTQTTVKFSSCAYTQKVRKFCAMMMARGHEVYVYSGDQNDAPCTEHIKVFTEAERAAALPAGVHYTQGSFNRGEPHWRKFNGRVTVEILDRIKPRDFLCILGGNAMEPISIQLPELVAVEIGIGYAGVFAPHKIFESYAWMHSVYAARTPAQIMNMTLEGAWYDDVIPNYVDPKEFPTGSTKVGDYLLFVGRLIQPKGVAIVRQIADALKMKVIFAGPGAIPKTSPPHVEFVGEVQAQKRHKLMKGARALIAPTIYIEPFGTVAIEAMACGTPVISSDWGGFTETVIPGVTGYRCRNLAEFCKAVQDVETLDRAAIRAHALATYGLEPIAERYERYFQRLNDHAAGGWEKYP